VPLANWLIGGRVTRPLLSRLAAGIEAFHAWTTVVERATVFKSGLNYLCVTESGLLVYRCKRTYDGNGHFTGYAARNYHWQWHEVGCLAFFHQTTWGGRTALFAWPAPGYVTAADHGDMFKAPATEPRFPFSRDSWPLRTKTRLTGVRQSRHGDKLLLEMKRCCGFWRTAVEENWRYLWPPDHGNPQDVAWEVCGATLFSRRRWRKIARAVSAYSPGRFELDTSAIERYSRRVRQAHERHNRCMSCSGHVPDTDSWLYCAKQSGHHWKHKDPTGQRWR
jgi:hypothetical protein